MPKETTDVYTYGWSWDEDSPEDWDFDGKWAVIYDLNVFDETKRRQQLGSQIVGNIMNQVRREGGERLYAMIGSADEGSGEFLKKNGFTIKEQTSTGTAIGYIDLVN